MDITERVLSEAEVGLLGMRGPQGDVNSYITPQLTAILLKYCFTLYYLYITYILPLTYSILPPNYPNTTVYYHVLQNITVNY